MTDSVAGERKGAMGVLGATAVGIGGMVGGGIFAVLGEAVSLAHGATALAFGLGGIIALLTSYSYAHLSVRFPSGGGTVTFIHRAFGQDLLTGSLNMILWLSYLVTLALYAVAFGSYGLTFFPEGFQDWLRPVLVSAAIILPIVINLFSAEVVSRSETLVVVVKLLLLMAVVAAGIPFVETARFSPATWGSSASIVAGGMAIFVAYEGFELIANASEEVRDPVHTLPRAFYGSVILVLVLYVAVALITVGTVPDARIAEVKDFALAEAARPALGQIGFTLVALSALLATFSAINATLYGSARLGFTLAKDGEMPEVLERKVWDEPVAGVLTAGGLALLMANLVDLRSIAMIASGGFLLVFAATNAAAVRLAGEIRGSPWISGVAGVACLGALGTLLVETARDNPFALWAFVSFLVFAAGFEMTYGKLRRKHLDLPGFGG
ncbi:MAG: APC family permease [Longimicrobiales bacterium]